MADKLLDIMSKIITELLGNTKTVKTNAEIEGKKTELLGRNTINRKRKELGNKMEQGNGNEKNEAVVDSRVKAKLKRKTTKKKENAKKLSGSATQ